MLSEGNVKSDLHVLNSEVLKNLTVVDIPDCLVVPDLAGKQNGTQGDPLPAARSNVNLGKWWSVG